MNKRLRLTPVLCTALGAAAGFYFLFSLGIAAIFAVTFILLASLGFLNVLSSIYPQKRMLQLIIVRSVAFACGIVLGISAASAGRNIVNFGIPQENIIALEGVLKEDPRIISGGRAMASLDLRRSASQEGLRVSSGGVITVFFPEEGAQRLREFGRGTTIFTEGQLRKTDTGYTFSAQSMHIVKPAAPIERMRTGIRLNLISRFDKGLPEAGGLALALLVGIRDNLDTSLSVKYREAGLSFILALSGMHLAILAMIISLLLKKPLGLKGASITGAVIICLYCFIVGPMPSLNRAALMYLLGVLAILGTLPKEPMSILSLSFLIQIIIAPASGNSLSFILSYLALAGILIIGQSLYSLLCGKIPDFILHSFTASCGAFLATAGVTSYTFGAIVPMCIITALFIVPLTTIFMVGSIVWLVLDIFSLSGILSAPLSLLYWLMEKIVSLASVLPGITAARPFAILVLSIVMSVLIVALEYRRRAALLRLQPFL